MKLLLTTLHSRYIHSSLALPCLAASCADISGLKTVIREHTVNERPEKLLVAIAGENADVVAFSCYIWNIDQTLRLAAELKLLRPETYIILGGPEVSFFCHELMLENPQIDLIVRGEGEASFRQLMLLLTSSLGEAIPDERLLEIGAITFRSGDEILSSPVTPEATALDSIPSPFAAGLADISKPLVYFESSRGCPFSCSFCLSSTEKGVRSFSMPRIKSDLSILMNQGVDTIKFVDRTFNFDAARADEIWGFILAHNNKSRFHFEIAADLLTDENIVLLSSVPPDTFRFEIGVQSTDSETLSDVERRSDLEKVFANVRSLKEETSVTVHLDLVAGLPGEDLQGFGRSLEKVLALMPDHIQIEPLKMLKGTAIRKSARDNGYSFSPYPPYRILKNRWLTFEEICRIESTSEAVEDIYNSGRFKTVLEMISRHNSLAPLLTSQQFEKSSANNLPNLFESLLKRIEKVLPGLREEARDALRFDYCMNGHPGKALPHFLAAADEKECDSSRQPGYPEIAERLSLPAKSRFRAFTAVFARDYRQAGWPERHTVITFAYCNGDSRQKVLLC
ncbi:MAG: DUF4080 domain-containing protein [Geobacteraceae bacterium]|nr:DUF4080 domain-containing protein [Geobacteraceae bacterium]